jgi:hypothetical protein
MGGIRSCIYQFINKACLISIKSIELQTSIRMGREGEEERLSFFNIFWRCASTGEINVGRFSVFEGYMAA